MLHSSILCCWKFTYLGWFCYVHHWCQNSWKLSSLVMVALVVLPLSHIQPFRGCWQSIKLLSLNKTNLPHTTNKVIKLEPSILQNGFLVWKKIHGEVVFVLWTMVNIRSEGKLCSDIHTLEREQVTIDQGKAKKETFELHLKETQSQDHPHFARELQLLFLSSS